LLNGLSKITQSIEQNYSIHFDLQNSSTKNAPPVTEGAFFVFRCGKRVRRLFGADGVGGAHARAGAAVDARAPVDNVNIASRDSFDRTFVDAGTASGAQIGIDFVSHFFSVLFK
jgi:hypothetical protein